MMLSLLNFSCYYLLRQLLKFLSTLLIILTSLNSYIFYETLQKLTRIWRVYAASSLSRQPYINKLIKLPSTTTNLWRLTKIIKRQRYMVIMTRENLAYDKPLWLNYYGRWPNPCGFHIMTRAKVLKALHIQNGNLDKT